MRRGLLILSFLILLVGTGSYATPLDLKMDLNFKKIPEDEEVERIGGKRLLIERTSTPPVIDGRIEELCWRRVGRADGFVLNDTGREPREKTEAYVTYDDKNLYLAFICHETEIDKIKAIATERDGSVWKDDCVEVFIDSDHDHFRYYHVVSNTKGVRYDEEVVFLGTVPTWNRHWNAVWQAEASVDKNSWSTEIAIPLKEIMSSRNDLWGLNLCRERYASEKPEFSSWSWTEGGFHKPKKFGHLIFKGDSYTIRSLSFRDPLWGENRLTCKIKNEDGKSRDITLIAETISEGGKHLSNSILVKVSSGEEKKIESSYRIEEGGEHQLILSLLEPKSKTPYFIAQSTISAPPPIACSLKQKMYFLEEKELRLDILVNVPEDFLKNVRIVISIETAEGQKLWAEEIRKIIDREINLGLDISDLTIGGYLLSVSLLDEKGRILFSSEEGFERIEGF